MYNSSDETLRVEIKISTPIFIMNQTQKIWGCIGRAEKIQALTFMNYSDAVKNSMLEDEELADLEKSDYAKIQRGLKKFLTWRNNNE